MMLIKCDICKYADPAVDENGKFYWCRRVPPTPVFIGTGIAFHIPGMKPHGSCGMGFPSVLRWLRKKLRGNET